METEIASNAAGISQQVLKYTLLPSCSAQYVFIVEFDIFYMLGGKGRLY